MCFPLQLAYFVANQMSQCGNVHRELEKDYDTPKSTVVFLVFSSPERTWPAAEHTGISVYPGRMLLMLTVILPLHQHTRLFTSTLENSGAFWGSRHLANLEKPMRVC